MPDNINEEEVVETVEQDVQEQPTQDLQAEPAQPENIPTIPWSKYGLDSRYDKMNPEQFAKEFSYRNETFGRQANELGELRRKHQEAEQKLKRFMEAADKPIEQPQSNEPDEMLIEQFYKLMEKGQPHKALDLLMKDKLSPKYDKDEAFQRHVQQLIQQELSQYHQYNVEQSVASDPDYYKYQDYIGLLRSEDHFGNNRSPKELMEFSRLVEENKPLADLTYSNMKSYPNMSFDDAKKFANLTLSHSDIEAKKKTEYVKQVKSLNSVTPPSAGSKKASEKEEYLTMDEAFA